MTVYKGKIALSGPEHEFREAGSRNSVKEFLHPETQQAEGSSRKQKAEGKGEQGKGERVTRYRGFPFPVLLPSAHGPPITAPLITAH